MNEVLLNKKVSIERCVAQIRKYYRKDNGVPFEDDYLKQDAIAMNLQRACECVIDMTNHLIRRRKLGLPRDSRESFALIQQEGLISPEQMKAMQAMIGFRNILVHEYQRLDLGIMVDVIENRLDDLLAFADEVFQLEG